jgi:hypothetical protein
MHRAQPGLFEGSVGTVFRQRILKILVLLPKYSVRVSRQELLFAKMGLCGGLQVRPPIPVSRAHRFRAASSPEGCNVECVFLRDPDFFNPRNCSI